MKLSKKSLIVAGFLPAFMLSTTLFNTANADLPKAFDYTKASTNYVDNSSSGGNGGASTSYYFGGTIGMSEASSYCSGSINCEDEDTAWKLFGGYKLSEKLGVEAAYVNLGDIHKNSENSDVSAFTATAVGTMPITEQFDIFGKIGAMRWSSDNSIGDDADGFGATYGIGAKMHLSETMNLRAEWEKFPSIETSPTDDTDINMLSVGVELSTY